MKRLFLILALSFSISANAGYYATITATNSSVSGACPVGKTSVCMMTAAMAISNACSYATVVHAIDSTAYTYSFGISNGAVLTGVFGECSAQPMGGAYPILGAGVSDPGIVAGGVSGGSGTGGSTSGTVTLDVPFEPDAFSMAVQSTLYMFVAGLSVGLIISLVRKVRYG